MSEAMLSENSIISPIEQQGKFRKQVLKIQNTRESLVSLMAADFFFTSNLFYLVSVIFFKQKDFPDFCKITTKLLIKLLLLSSVPLSCPFML